MLPLVRHHAFHVLRIVEGLMLDQDVFAVRLGHRVRILRIDDDRADHAAGDVLDHRIGAAMIEEHAGIVGGEGEALAFRRA